MALSDSSTSFFKELVLSGKSNSYLVPFRLASIARASPLSGFLFKACSREIKAAWAVSGV